MVFTNHGNIYNESVRAAPDELINRLFFAQLIMLNTYLTVIGSSITTSQHGEENKFRLKELRQDCG